MRVNNVLNGKSKIMKSIALVFAIHSSLTWAEAPPHAAYGPMSIGRNDVIRVDIDTAVNVFAVSQSNYQNYQNGKSFRYVGRRAKSSPVYLTPGSGTYIVVIDNGGGSIGGIKAGVRVMRGK